MIAWRIGLLFCLILFKKSIAGHVFSVKTNQNSVILALNLLKACKLKSLFSLVLLDCLPLSRGEESVVVTYYFTT